MPRPLRACVLHAAVLFLLLTIAGPATALDVPLAVKEVAGVGATDYPAAAVVPLTIGAYHDTGQFRVAGPDGATVPAQFEVLSRWWARDNSIRHVLVHFQPTVSPFIGPGTGIATYRLRDDGGSAHPAKPVTVSETAGAITITSGAQTIVVRKSPFRIETPAGTVEATVTQASGVQRSFDRTDVVVDIEERGPMRAVIRAEAPTIYTGPSNHLHGWAVRLYVYAGRPWLKVDYQIQNSAKTKVYAAPLYFQSIALTRPGGVPATVRYAAELGSLVTPTAVELIPASGAWSSGLYWLDDMRHVVFETMYWLDGTSHAETFQFPPTAMLPTAWYAETRATLDQGGVVPTVAADLKTDRRRPSAVDAAHSGWDNFHIDGVRKLAPSMAGGIAYSGSKWVATEDPADVFEAERVALGELNVRPQWMAQYQHDRDWPVLQLSTNPDAGSSWRKYEPGGTGLVAEKLDAPYLPGTERRSHPRDDSHGWFYHVEEAYWATANPWIRDWYGFVAEFRRVFLQQKDPYPDISSRGIAHALANALQAYRILGTPVIVPEVRTYLTGYLKSTLYPTGGRASGWESGDSANPPFESVFMTGYLTRMLISYLEEIGGDPEVSDILGSLVSWNVRHANFGYNVNPADPNLEGVSSGTAVTMSDPQAWLAWKTGDSTMLDHLKTYIASGINGGEQPYIDVAGDPRKWTGDFIGRVSQFVLDGAAAPSPAPTDPPSGGSDLPPGRDEEPPAAPPTATLTVIVDGHGGVSSTPAGIACGTLATCVASYARGTVVTLVATPSPGHVFVGWSPGCSDTMPCSVTMDAAISLTATFAAMETLTVERRGKGHVASRPAGIDCGATCTASYPRGMLVTLTATPASGQAFAGWSGACTGTGVCTVTMEAATRVTARFVGRRVLKVKVVGAGLATSTPGGIACGTMCKATFEASTVVMLTARAVPGSVFKGWSGACSGTGTCAVRMNAAKSVTAKFARLATKKVRAP